MALIYEVTSNHNYWLHSTKEWMRYEKEHYVCKSKVLCNKLDRTIFPKPIDVVIKELPESRIIHGSPFGSVVSLYHIDFINQIRTKMDRFVFGKCYLPDKTLVEEYVTCYSKDVIVIRGACGSNYIQCVDCKSIVSAKDPIYVLQRYLTDASVYQDAIQRLYIDEDLAGNLDFSSWPDMELEPVPIQDKPVDKVRLICDKEDSDLGVSLEVGSVLYKTIFGIFPECSPPTPVYADSDWLEKEVGRSLCGHCKFINRKKNVGLLNVVLENEPEEGVPCAVVESTGIMLWHRGFLEIIQDYLQGYEIGDCYLANGDKLLDYKTCYSAGYIYERGNKQSKYDTCPTCGATTSVVRPGPVFISGKDLPQKDIYQDARCNFYLTEKAASLFDFKNWEVIEDYYSHYLYFETISLKS